MHQNDMGATVGTDQTHDIACSTPCGFTQMGLPRLRGLETYVAGPAGLIANGSFDRDHAVAERWAPRPLRRAA